MQLSSFWIFLSGIGFFLFGMSNLERILKNIPGRSFKLFIKKNTRNVFKSIVGTALLTGILQSSSVISLITLSFVEAGIIPFRNALGVMLGANLGTTLDSWIIAVIGFKLNILNYALPLISIAAIAVFAFEKMERWKNIFSIILFLGFLFLGVNNMKDGAMELSSFIDLSRYSDLGNFVFVLVGFVLTAIIQSSLATVTISLTALYSGIIDFPHAVALVIGSEAGTSVKTLLWSLSGTVEKRRVGWANFIFNVFTVIFSIIFLPWLLYWIKQVLNITDNLLGLVFFQSMINVIAIVFFLPFVGIFSKWIEKIIVKKSIHELSYAHPNLPLVPTLAVDAMKAEAMNLATESIGFCHQVLCFDPEGNSLLFEQSLIETNYSRLKKTEGDLNNYYMKISLKDLKKIEADELSRTLHAIRRVVFASKSVKDIMHNLIMFDNSADDFIYDQRKLIHQMWLDFESGLSKIKLIKDFKQMNDALESLLQNRSQWNDEMRSNILVRLQSHKITDMEASTLLNVYRALFSSKKSFIKAMRTLYLD